MHATATTITSVTIRDRAKLIIIAALLALSLVIGMAATTTHVGAEKPRTGQTAAAPKAKLQTTCVQLDVDQWYFLTGEHTDAGGFYCFKV